jgi:hypothetical protein
MESQSYKIIKSFITETERDLILDWLKNTNHTGNPQNKHLQRLSETLRGSVMIFDISNNDLTNYITNFQSVTTPTTEKIPDFLTDITQRVAKKLNLSTENIFLQIVDMNKGGKIDKHYDASIDGFITYKCNISVISEDYVFNIDKDKLNIEAGDLYCFEASLYKHWTDEFNYRRVLLSIGFILPYSHLNRTEDEPRIRLGKRIQKYFQNIV